jgi:predicted kinase
MTTFVCMVGIPASGKSTYVKQYEQLGYVVFSSDVIRERLYGDSKIQGDPKEVFSTLSLLIQQTLGVNKSCILDATNINRRLRTRFLANLNLPENIHKKCIYINKSLEECLQNNESRDRVVPINVIIKMFNNLQEPTMKEGWDSIWRINPQNNETVSVSRRQGNVSPNDGGCWFCCNDENISSSCEEDEWCFSDEWDAWFHYNCYLEAINADPNHPEALIIAREFGWSVKEY